MIGIYWMEIYLENLVNPANPVILSLLTSKKFYSSN